MTGISPLISHLPRNAKLPGAIFDQLFAGVTPESWHAGQTLFLQDDPSQRVFGIVSGRIEISLYSRGGRKLVANIETPRSLVGEIGALDGGVRTASATCISDCRLVSLSRAQLFERIERDGRLATEMIGLLCARLRWVNTEFGDQVLLKIEARLAKRLLFLHNVLAEAEGWIPISQSELAEFLGTTRESVNKALAEWRDAGVIDIRRGGVRVLGPSQLVEAIGEPWK